jgi:hypothetical protein
LDQDWEICSAAPNRLREFLALYGRTSLTEDEKFTLMEIILASFDALLEAEGQCDDVERLLGQAIRCNFELHAFTVHYWCLWDHGDHPAPHEQFHITPFMRKLWLDACQSPRGRT